MRKQHQTSNAIRLTTTLAILISFLFTTGAFSQGWEHIKLPGGAPHKTIFIDHADIDAMASVNMGDRLSIKSYSNGSWANQWAQVGTYEGDFGTRGLDWADIDNDVHIVTCGYNWVKVYYYSGGWNEENVFTANPTFPVEESVFYDNGDGIDEVDVLICKTQTNTGPNYYGLFRWVGGFTNEWTRIGDATNSSEGFGYRMWRCLQQDNIIYMTGPDDNGHKKIWSVDATVFTNTGFDPMEVIRSDNTNPQVTSVNEAPAFCQWKDSAYYYQYIVASTTYEGTSCSIDVWMRCYNDGWGNWTRILNNIDGSGQLRLLGDQNHYIQNPVAIAARNIPGTDDHRVYLATNEYGLTAYNTLNGTQTAVDLNNIENEDNRLNVFKFRYLDICPFASDNAKDVVFYSYDGMNYMIELEWDS